MSTSENREAAFIASVTAGTTHEIRNVLAIVKESAGLIEDLVRSFGRQGPQHEDKITRAVSRIDAQIGRGASLLSHLNRFAHSLDHAAEEVDCDQEVQQVASLCQFRARRKRQHLRVEAKERELKAFVSPFRLQMALFTAVECCLEQLPEGSTVRITTDRKQNRTVVDFAGEEVGKATLPTPPQAGAWNRLVEILGSFGASVEANPTAYGFRLVLPTARSA